MRVYDGNAAQVRNTGGYLKPNAWKIYDSKTVIFTLQISVMLNYGKIVVEEFVKELKLINVVAISRYWQSWRP